MSHSMNRGIASTPRSVALRTRASMGGSGGRTNPFRAGDPAAMAGSPGRGGGMVAAAAAPGQVEGRGARVSAGRSGGRRLRDDSASFANHEHLVGGDGTEPLDPRP